MAVEHETRGRRVPEPSDFGPALHAAVTRPQIDPGPQAPMVHHAAPHALNQHNNNQRPDWRQRRDQARKDQAQQALAQSPYSRKPPKPGGGGGGGGPGHKTGQVVEKTGERLPPTPFG